MMEALENIVNVYSVFFGELPRFDNEGDSKTQKAVNALRFYAKIRNFVAFIFQNSKKLVGDVKFLESRVSQLHNDEQGMMEFYDLDYIHNEQILKYRRLSWEKENQMKKHVENEFLSIDAIAQQFSSDVMSVFRGMYDIKKFTEFFMTEINQISKLDYDSIILNILDKIDDLIMTTFQVMTMKDQIFKSVQELKQSMMNLGTYKGQIMTIQKSIGELLELERLSEERKIKEKQIADQKALEAKKTLPIWIPTVISLILLY